MSGLRMKPRAVPNLVRMRYHDKKCATKQSRRLMVAVKLSASGRVSTDTSLVRLIFRRTLVERLKVCECVIFSRPDRRLPRGLVPVWPLPLESLRRNEPLASNTHTETLCVYRDKWLCPTESRVLIPATRGLSTLSSLQVRVYVSLCVSTSSAHLSLLYVAVMATRKRAPLVHRPSNVDSLDWRGACKLLAEASGDEEIDRLIILVSELVPANTDLDIVLKLFLAKIGKRVMSESSRARIVILLGQASPQSQYVFPLVRTLVRSSGGLLVEWCKSSVDIGQLLVHEMTAWDSISDGQVNKRRVAESLERLGFMSRFSVEVALALSKAVGPCTVLEAICSPNHIPAVVADLAHAELTKKEKSVAAGLLVNIGFWIALLTKDADAAKACADSAMSMHTSEGITGQASLLLALLGMRVSDNLSILAQVVASIKIGDSIGHLDLGSENRYEVALAAQLLASDAKSPVERIVFASYALHCVKFSDAVKHKTPVARDVGIEGFLSLLVSDASDRLLASLIPSIPPFAKLFIALDSVRVAATAYEEIGYLPGASWLYQRGLEYISLVDDGAKLLCAPFASDFKTRLSLIHKFSPTRIADDTFDNEKFGLQDALGLDGVCSVKNVVGVSERIAVLADTVKYGHMLHLSGMSHLARIQAVRKALATRVAPVRATVIPSVQYTVADDILTLRVGAKLFKVSENATDLILSLVEKFDKLLLKNKEQISQRLTDESDSKDFWTERKLVDAELGQLLQEVQLDVVPVEALAEIQRVCCATSLVWLELPDLLSSLPVESFPSFEKFVCVRHVRPWGPAQPERALRHKAFVINPNGDCRTTETSILPRLEESGWEGRSGHPSLPDKEFANLLSQSDVFLFSGHGGGEKHWPGSLVQRLPLHPESRGSKSVAMLMGCSSAKPYGDYAASFCTPFHYLVGGFRVVVGTLWDVLGRELDRMTVHMIAEIEKIESTREMEENFPEIVARAKKMAKLTHLSAASIVVYAFPFNANP